MVAAIDLEDVFLLCQQADDEDSPHADETMHGGSGERVVDLKLEEHHADELKDDSTSGSGKDGSPRLKHMTSGGDGNKATKDSITDCEEIPALVADESKDEP